MITTGVGQQKASSRHVGSTLKVNSRFIAIQNDFFGDRHHITTVWPYRQNKEDFKSLDDIIRLEYSRD